MNQLFARLTDILRYDPGNRGLLEHIPASNLQQAADLLETSNEILIVTGFPITGMNIGETDGPIGAVSMAHTLARAGKKVTLATDRYSYDLVRACNRSLPQAADETAIFLFRVEMEDSEASCRTLLNTIQPDLIIAIERPGKGADGHFHNMRGQFIDEMTADTDSLLTAGIPVIAIGDGGNELGMGNYLEMIEQHVPHGDLIAARKTSTVPLAAGISNWWGWGLSAMVSAIYGRDLMTTAAEEETLLKACVAAGGVDGVLKEAILSVDGLAGGGIAEIHAPIRAALEDFLNRCK